MFSKESGTKTVATASRKYQIQQKVLAAVKIHMCSAASVNQWQVYQRKVIPEFYYPDKPFSILNFAMTEWVSGQLPPRKKNCPLLKLGFGFGLVLELGDNFPQGQLP